VAEVKWRWLTAGIVAGLLLGTVMVTLSWRSGKTAGNVDLTDLPADGKILGYADAPVLVEVFSDYQCPWCARAALELDQEITREYVASGRARLQFRDFPFIGMESYWAAIAAGCAAEQNKYWPYHYKLFEEQQGENKSRYTEENLKKWAQELELDMAAFNRCYAEETSALSVRADYQAGLQRKVYSTPTYFVNGRQVVGMPQWRELQKIILEEYAKAR
jgi:protein-disulfide isomerase